MMTLMFDITLVAYLVALLISVLSLFIKWKRMPIGTIVFLALGLLTHTVYIAARWVEAGRAPFSNMFESMVLFAWAMIATYLALRTKVRIRALDAAISFFAVVTLAYSSAFGSDIKPLMPALQSNWLAFHVLTCFLGYAAFADSFLAAIGYLISARKGSSVKDETLASLEMFISKNIAFGFLFLTIGIISGAVWANSAWGTYWSWDPKETWSLITWIIYAFFLHCRFMKGWKGHKTAWIAIIGFASVLFTYFGVNFLLSGLHSYA